MNISKLRKAVKIAASLPDGILFQAELEELQAMEQMLAKSTDYDIWKGDVQLVDTSAMIDLMNQYSYDDYGKLARASEDDEATFEQYAEAVRFFSPTLTDENLQCGYDIVHDLWSDNEAYGSNNADGTFKKGVE